MPVSWFVYFFLNNLFLKFVFPHLICFLNSTYEFARFLPIITGLCKNLCSIGHHIFYNKIYMHIQIYSPHKENKFVYKCIFYCKEMWWPIEYKIFKNKIYHYIIMLLQCEKNVAQCKLFSWLTNVFIHIRKSPSADNNHDSSKTRVGIWVLVCANQILTKLFNNIPTIRKINTHIKFLFSISYMLGTILRINMYQLIKISKLHLDCFTI